MTNKSRYPFIDITRGIAVILMIIFHFFYDLSAFNFVEINFQKDFFWYWLPRVIVFLFLYSVGLSLEVSHHKHLKIKPYLIRLLKIGIGAILISIFTYYTFRKSWIYFGTLHCIFFVTIIATPFIKRHYLSLLAAVIIIALEMIKMPIPFFAMPHASMDYIPLFPWVSITLLAIFSTKFNYYKVRIAPNKIVNAIAYLGKHSFKIYIIHQPILYSIVYLASVLMA